MEELSGLPVIYVLCYTRFWSITLKVSVWTAHNSNVVSLYDRDDPVHHDKVHKEKMFCTWGSLLKESWRYIYQCIKIRSKFNRFLVTFASTQEMYCEFVKFHFPKASLWCSIKQSFHLNNRFFVWHVIKPLPDVDIGTWAKLYRSDSKLFANEISI